MVIDMWFFQSLEDIDDYILQDGILAQINTLQFIYKLNLRGTVLVDKVTEDKVKTHALPTALGPM